MWTGMLGVDTVTATAERRAFEQSVRALLQPIRSYLHRRLSEPDAADDCLSEVLLVLWRRGDLLPAGDELRLYAYGVARNVLRNHERGARRRLRLQRALDAEAAVLPQHHHDRIDDGRLTAALAALPERDRELLLLVAWDGLSSADAGAVLGLSAGATRVRTTRARARLRALLDDGGTA